MNLKDRVAQASSLNSLTHKQDAYATFLNPNADIIRTKRNLPHWSQNNVMYFVTFRLADSIPQEKLQAWKEKREIWLTHNPEPWSDHQWKEYDERFGDRLNHWLDVGSGNCCLGDPTCAEIVSNALRHFDGTRYILDEWVVMPNHVHLLVTLLGGHQLSDILHSWKSFTANAINKLRKTGGQLWQHESYDHIVRSPAQLQHLRKYIHENPAKARIKVSQASNLNREKHSSNFQLEFKK